MVIIAAVIGGFNDISRQNDVWIWQQHGVHDPLEHHLWADGYDIGGAGEEDGGLLIGCFLVKRERLVRIA